MHYKYSLSFLTCCFYSIYTFSQVTNTAFKPFIGDQKIIHSSGPGLTQISGDILLELREEGDEDMVTLMIIRNTKGKLSKIAENSSLLMGPGMLGNAGGGQATLSDDELSIDYGLGSNSAYSSVSTIFVKANDGSYYFKEYTTETSNYEVENLFARERITAAQTGKMDFSTTSESKILEKAKINTSPVDPDEPLYKVSKRYAKYIPEGFQLAAFAEGDLNLDAFNKDLLLILYNEEICSIRILMQQKNGSYALIQKNDALVPVDETFNINNLRTVIKNGFFTVEQRVATNDKGFDHRYITFKYDATQKNWFLHRYDVDRFKGYETKPSGSSTNLVTADFGSIPFSKLNNIPPPIRHPG